jgi:hypothetical protein
MSTESAENNIDFLFASENAAPSGGEANHQPSEQPTPPDVDAFAQTVPEASPQPHEQQPVPGQEQPPAQQPQAQPQQHTVPLAEHIELRKRAQAAEESQRQQQQRLDQLEQMMARFNQPQQPQQPQPQIDPYEDPEAFAHSMEQRIEQRFLNMSLNESERRARDSHGAEAVDAAFEAARRSGFSQAFVNKPDAYGEMVRWHKAQQLSETIGGDPNAYKERLKAELKQQLLAEMRQGTPPPSNITPPLSSATRADPNQAGAIGSDNDFFNDMMNRKRG